MMSKVVHVIGNGDMSSLYHLEKRHGMKLTCNIPPFAVPDAYCTFMVDFKIMNAITQGEVEVPGEWIVGMRPKIWMDKNPTFYIKRAHQIKEFYTHLPKYAKNYTDFNCGHMAVHYACNKILATEVHMYGFDSIFDFNLRSSSDFYLSSLRDNTHSNKLKSEWRPLWEHIFNEFSHTQFKLYHNHSNIKINLPKNASVVVGSPKDVKIKD